MTWTELKQSINKFSLVKYIETDDKYDIWYMLGNKKLDCEILKEDPINAEQTNFESVCKALANYDNVTEVDELGRWVVRADSRRRDWDVVFQGSGDNMSTGKMGDGMPFTYDFSDPVEDIKWITDGVPSGFKRQRIDWMFADYVYLKEGTLYFYDMPKGSYIDLWLVSPAGEFYPRKLLDANQDVVKDYLQAGALPVPFMHWVVKYMMEGSAPMGDELNTESAAENPASPGLIFRAEVTVPDDTGYESAHGHWSLEIYRTSYDPLDDPN